MLTHLKIMCENLLPTYIYTLQHFILKVDIIKDLDSCFNEIILILTSRHSM
ncbi:hypothetical protein Lalb_Chr04g0249031 [Lupinus albus]|uniref:Uncharacterized protein n=1 Tax=Lupinus albus TaxID=3870 RepID=A0A6A4QLM6_LUPAL|nr:hypothetical protein Lalb_Chr04g0249031 [Lupinus albus]